MERPSASISEIVGIVGRENVLTAPEDLCCYSYDASRIERLPACVVHPGKRR